MNRSIIIRQYEQLNRRFEALYYPKVRKAIRPMITATVSRLRSGGFMEARRYLHEPPVNAALGAVIKDLYAKVGRRHAQITYSRLLNESRRRKYVTLYIESKGFGFNAQWTQYILDYLSRFLLEKITIEIAATTRDALLRTLAMSVTAGWSVDKTIEHLQDWPFERYQAARIVRTEVNRAANVGATAQAETSDYQQQKEWISARDFRVRGNNPKDHASHVALNGTVVDEGDEFTDPRNGDRLRFPGDPQASAASTVNCRCQAAYTLKRDSNGNPVRKRRLTTVLYPGQVRRPQTITI